ncbi:MAG: NTP transferase domain-containing protein [Candidatus Verstraetearchaeota archaeon]|nr:NTP transferase domain-containing protein [Candidatus Verstraetearchaeota archaeon]
MTKGIILAAGKGTRLDPFTISRPKHLIPIAGAPLIEHIINTLKENGINEIIIVINYMGELIKSYLGDGSKFSIKINYVEQKTLEGTAHALYSCRDLINNESFIAIYGDIVFHPSIISTLLSSYNEKYFGVILGVHVKNIKDFGLLITDGEFLTKIEEKPDVNESGIINGGMYIFKPEIFKFIEKTEKSIRGEIELTSSINMAIKENKKFLIVKSEEDKWIDVGKPWDILDANKLLMDVKVNKKIIHGDVEDGVHINGNVVIEKNAKILSGTYIEGPVWISSGCRVGPNCYLRPYTYLCKNVRVGNACEIKNSIIMEDTHISHLSYIGDSVIGAKCNIGAGTIIANLKFNESTVKVKIKGEKIDSGKRKLGAFIGDNVKTGINVSINPGVKIGPNCWIAPNTFVYKDVPKNSFLTQKFEIELKEK